MVFDECRTQVSEVSEFSSIDLWISFGVFLDFDYHSMQSDVIQDGASDKRFIPCTLTHMVVLANNLMK